MALFGYRISVQESTKRSPAELLYGRQIRLPMNWDLFLPKLDFSKKLKENWRRAQEGVARAAAKNKARHDNKNKPISYKTGEWIRLKNEATKVGLSKKLIRNVWSRPLEIKQVLGNNVKLSINNKDKWVSQARIKKAEENLQ